MNTISIWTRSARGLQIGLICILGLTAHTASAKGKGTTLSQTTQQQLLNCIFQQHRPGWYFSPKRIVLSKRKAVGVYRSTPGALLVAFRLPQCVRRIHPTTQVYRNRGLHALHVLSKLPIYAPEQGTQRHSYKVNYYNPQLFTWLEKNIPSPKNDIGKNSFQHIYTIVLRRFVRITAYTYMYVRQKNLYRGLIKKYKAVHLVPGQTKSYRYRNPRSRRLRRSIQKRFERLIVDPILFNTSGRFLPYHYHAGHAALFWIRRGIDGTHKHVWSLLRSILRTYDSAFWNKYSNNPKIGHIRIQLPKLPPAKIYRLGPQDAARLQSVIYSAPPYSSIHLKAGYYRINQTLKIPAKKGLLIQGSSQGNTTFLMGNRVYSALLIKSAYDIQLRDLRIEYTSKRRGSSIVIQNTTGVLIDRCTLHGPTRVGLNIWNSQNISLTNSTLQNHLQYAIGGRSVRKFFIRNNTIINNARSIVCSYSCELFMNHNTIQNNRARKYYIKPRFIRSLKQRFRQNKTSTK